MLCFASSISWNTKNTVVKDHHVGLATTWNDTDDKIHAIYCSDCKNYVVQEEPFGGDASCTEDAVCEECGTVYSAADEHRPVTPLNLLLPGYARAPLRGLQ